MKKNEIFTFTAPNGVEVTGVVISVFVVWTGEDAYVCSYLAYAQNRLFSFYTIKEGKPRNIDIVVDYAVLPEYDKMLENVVIGKDKIHSIRLSWQPYEKM